MKLIKYASIVALLGTLVGCGHGYEGEYQSKTGSSNEFMNAFAGAAGSQKIVIGSDYIESQGQRTEFDDIFVRESGGESYLVFKVIFQGEVGAQNILYGCTTNSRFNPWLCYFGKEK